jgi:hypothetical protein
MMPRRPVLLASVAFFAFFVAATAGAQEGRSIALILDASGSMNAKLAGGQIRIEAAKVNTEDGMFVANFSTSAALLPVPPRKYVLEVAGQAVPLGLAAGQRMEISLR